MISDSPVALVTGAGSGVGRAVSMALLNAGYCLTLAGRRLERLAETASLAGPQFADRILIAATDVADEESVRALFEKIQQRFGRLDLLFNNAGINVPATPIEDLTLDQWRSVLDVNLTGPFLCAREAFRLMKSQTPQGGRIINNGSVSADRPRPHSVPYTASKHAITGLTKSLALDGRRYGIACGQIDIGNAETDMASRMKRGVLQADGETRVEPTMHVDNVARAVLAMATMPADANVLFLTVMATNMPLVGRG